MERLNENIAALHGALTAARSDDLDRLAYALDHASVVGVHGEPEVGKTKLIREALAARGQHTIQVELAAVADEQDVAGMLARGFARWLLASDHGLDGPSLATLALPDGLRPGTASRVRAQLAHEIGADLLALALADHASDVGTIRPDEVLYRIIKAADQRSAKPPLLWFDHLEAPGLTPRHPVDVDKLLWTVRAETQVSDMPVILSGSKAASEVAYGKQAAYYGDGTWLQIGRPDPAVWGAIANRTRVASAAWGTHFAALTDGHPSTTLIGLATRPELAGEPSPMDVWKHLVALENGLTERTLQYARQSHRLGGRVLLTIAQGDGPYVGTPDQAARKDIHKAMQKLHRAGLVTQPAPRTWTLTNPIVEARLGGRLRVKQDVRRTSKQTGSDPSGQSNDDMGPD